MNMESLYHVPVLLEESVFGLNIDPEGVYLDLTFGGGGHSREILKRLDGGCLIGFDQDSDALANVPDDSRFIFVNHNFRYLRNFLRYCGYDKADGILADLGVSSHEFDEAGRGFSFRFDAELDMRMNRKGRLKATDVLNTYSEEELIRVFREYGEVENARGLVGLILKARAEKFIERSEEFLQVIAPRVPEAEGEKIFGTGVSSVAYRGKRGIGCIERDVATSGTGIASRGTFGGDYLSLAGRPDREEFPEEREFRGKSGKRFLWTRETKFRVGEPESDCSVGGGD